MPTEPAATASFLSENLDRTPLVDRFGRVHDSLRISVTDRCNIRCFYCMPDGPIEFLPSERILSFPQIEQIVRLLAHVGVRKIRLTGGEPLLRPELDQLIERLAGIEGVDDLALTTNGVLLDRYAVALRNAGLKRVNISLDTLQEATFQKISRRPGLQRVLQGIDAALTAGFAQVRLNALAIRGISEAEIIPLAEFAHSRQLQLRFIEYMPLDADRRWDPQQVLSGQEILQRLSDRFGPLLPATRDFPSQPAEDYVFAESGQHIGVIRPVTSPFCGDCNRLRLTAEGSLRNCLFSLEDWDLRQHLAKGNAAEFLQHVRNCVAAKKAGHLISNEAFQQPARAMYQIGG
jgi:GTP 3',8-cyclase